MSTKLAFASLLAMTIITIPATADENPKELGRVEWLREYDEAISKSAETGKPVLILFQEIPGCSTCVEFGEKPLSHPLVVEAMETEFIPLAIHNNKPGRDAEILKKFEEPSWNYPVARFLDETGSDIIPRKDEVWTTHGLVSRMIVTLEKADRNVPEYLRLIASETTPEKQLATATFAMHCYWEGEAQIGSFDGIINTTAGWLDGKEVVEVTYDPKTISYEKLLNFAIKTDCASTIFARDESQYNKAKAHVPDRTVKSDEPSRLAKASDQDYHLKRSQALKYLPLTPMQRTKLNAAVRLESDVLTWLSPRQRALATELQRIVSKNPDALKDLTPPEDGKELAAYAATLRAHLEKSSE